MCVYNQCIICNMETAPNKMEAPAIWAELIAPEVCRSGEIEANGVEVLLLLPPALLVLLDLSSSSPPADGVAVASALLPAPPS